MPEQMTVEHTLEPWFDSRSRVLILGTIPSVMSRKTGSYYGHPQNRFWKTIAFVFDVPVPASVEERRAFCAKHGIALWDVLASCDIHGSEDASIRSPQPNDLSRILNHADIRAVFTTGKKAKALYDALSLGTTEMEAIALPSTSPANRRWASQEVLNETYAQVKAYCSGMDD